MIVDSLQKLGLSAYEARIYLYLIEYGNLRIQQIANGTNIPRSSVYHSLKQLLKSGLTQEIIDRNFTKIQAYPLSVLKHTWTEKLMQLEELDRNIQHLPRNLGQQSQVHYYKGVSGARQLLWNTLKTKNTVLVYSFYGRSQFVGRKFYMDFVKESKERKFKEKVLINPTAHTLDLIKRDTGSATARTNPHNIRYLQASQLLINGETFIYDNTYSIVYLRAHEISGIEIESQDFVHTQRSMFNHFWKIASPIKL